MEKHRLFAINTAKFIQEICYSLQNIAVTNFMHDITFGNGQISMLVSHAEILQFYYKNKIPTLCTDNSGRTLAPGIYINKLLQSSYRECAILIPLMQKVGQQFNQNYGRNSLSIIVRENDCQHLYSLFFDLDEIDFIHWIINNGNLLRDVLENYNFLAKDIILEAKSIENRIILPNFSDLNLLNHNLINDTNEIHISIIHKITNIPIHLSNQQSKCLLLLMKGKSAKEIALDIGLSHRTVEHYLEKIRKLLGCSSNKELIISYSEQLF